MIYIICSIFKSFHIPKKCIYVLKKYKFNWLSPCFGIEKCLKIYLFCFCCCNSKYQKCYDSVEDIDIYSAGVTEASETGLNVGPTFACLLQKTFEDLKFGDRFWYENDLDSDQVKKIYICFMLAWYAMSWLSKSNLTQCWRKLKMSVRCFSYMGMSKC